MQQSRLDLVLVARSVSPPPPQEPSQPPQPAQPPQPQPTAPPLPTYEDPPPVPIQRFS
jgi:hypothetical protein